MTSNPVRRLALAALGALTLAAWGGLFPPTGRPAAAVETWTQEVRRITAMPEVRKRILDVGFLPVGSSGPEFAKDLAAEIQKWDAVVRANNIKME